jgi:hypothetical protein
MIPLCMSARSNRVTVSSPSLRCATAGDHAPAHVLGALVACERSLYKRLGGAKRVNIHSLSRRGDTVVAAEMEGEMGGEAWPVR